MTHYVSFDGDAGPDPRLGDVARVAEGLLRIVEVEGPMLVKRSYDIYLRGCGIRKMGGPLRRAMNQALRYAVRTGDVVTEDESGTGDLLDAIARLRTAPPVLVRNRESDAGAVAWALDDAARAYAEAVPMMDAVI